MCVCAGAGPRGTRRLVVFRSSLRVPLVLAYCCVRRVCVCVCVCSDSKERSVARRLWLKQSSILSLQVSGAGVVSLCCHLLATILFPSSDVAPLWAVVHCHRHLKWLFPCGFLVLKRRSFSRKVRACGLPWSPGPVDTKIE